MNDETNTKIAVLEQRMGYCERELVDNRATLHDVRETLQEISDQLLKHRGFIGGIIFTVSSLWAVALAVVGWFASNHK